MTSRATAADRVLRILAILPWIAENDGPTIDEVCSRFGLDRTELVADLDLVLMLGVPPYTPDVMLEAWVEDGRVYALLGGRLSRPPRFTPAQALALVATASTLTRLEPPEGPLHSALAKLETLLPAATDHLEMQAPDDPEGVAPLFGRAIAERLVVEIDYYSFTRDDRSVREVEPVDLYLADGAWYVDAWCRRAEAIRSFRLDRIHGATPRPDLERHVDESPVPSRREGHFAFGDRVAVLELGPRSEWLVEGLHRLEREEIDGRVRIRLGYSDDAWLTRLALRLAPDGRIVEPPEAAEGAAAWARRILNRYSDSHDVESPPGGDSLTPCEKPLA